MLEDEQLNEDMSEDPTLITGVDGDPEDDPMIDLPDNTINDDGEIEELHLGER